MAVPSCFDNPQTLREIQLTSTQLLRWCLFGFACSGLMFFRAAQAAVPIHRLVWEQGEGFRRAKLNVPAEGKAGFTLLGPEETGLRWTNKLSLARVNQRQNLMNGAGVAAGDFDGDGLCDLYFCNKEGANALFRNLGNGQFEDVAAQASVGCTN